MTAGEGEAVAVSGSNIYVAGEVYIGTNDIAAYWLNGVATVLPLPTGAIETFAYAVAVSRQQCLYRRISV